MFKTHAILLSLHQNYDYGLCEVRIGDALIGYRPYDGSTITEIAAEVNTTLADVLNERLGWSREEDNDDD
jgi:hypothetical protein